MGKIGRLFLALVLLSLPILATESVVAIHVSELTQALESMPATAPTPTGTGTTGHEWWIPWWRYFVMPDSVKEALRSDGTPFVVVSDADITAGVLLMPDGKPRYPIVISLAAEAIRDDEIDPLRAYVAAGGFLVVGSSSFTRRPNGTSRGDFALASEMGLHTVSGDLENWVQENDMEKTIEHRLVSHIAADYLTWEMPLTSEDISWGISPDHIHQAYHYLWQVEVGDATEIAATSHCPYLLTKAYGLGRFIYHAGLQPLVGHGGHAPGMYAYGIFRKAIEWAFESANLPLIRLSPWPFIYNAAYMVRHDLENSQWAITNIEESAQEEHSVGAKGDYYFCTGTLRAEMENDQDVVDSIRYAISEYGATIGSHNGGLRNPHNPSLLMEDFDYWHWGLDEALDTSPPGYANGREYAYASLAASFADIDGWLVGLTTNKRTWVSPYFNSTRDASFGILEQAGVTAAGEQKLTPFPHWTLSTQTLGKRFAFVSLPASDWVIGERVRHGLDDGHDASTIQAMVDAYYDQGALVNLYSHNLSTEPLPNVYLLACAAKPAIWATNATDVSDWWAKRSSVQVTPSHTFGSGRLIATIAVTGATDAETAIELAIPAWALVSPGLQVKLNGAPADPSSFRVYHEGIKVKVGTTVSTVEVSYPFNGIVALDDSYDVLQGGTLDVAAPGVLGNDLDGGADLTAVLEDSTSHGELTLNSDGSFSYEPALGFSGADSFTYRADAEGVLTNIATVIITVTPVIANDAPVITEGAGPVAVTSDEDNAPVAFALTLHATDGDGDTLTWSIQTAASHGTATAGGTGTSKVIGYTPAANWNGADSFVLLVSDGNGGEDTITVNVTVNPINDAPANTVPLGQTVNEDTNMAFLAGNNNAITVADSDVAETVNGNLMITLAVSHGRLYLAQSTGLTFSVGDGSADPTMTFTGLPSSINAAMNGMVYQGETDYSGPDALSIITSDMGNTGAGGVMTDTDAVDITVTGANDAPVLNNLNYTLASVTEDQTDNAGTLVTALITSGGGDGITDSDPGAQEGIAIIARDNTHGVWEYSLDGVNWTDLGAVSSASARLLYADGNTWLRFNPALSYNNAQTPTLVFRAWDRTGGLTNGSTANVSVIGTGGATPFSTASDSAGIYVTAVNDAPVLDSSGSMSLTTIPEDVLDADNVGTLVQDIILSAGGNRITDVDTGMLEGIALVGADGANGTWQFSTNNGALWTACGSLSDLSATVLRSDAVTRIRFVPVANFSGSAYIVFRAWDQTSGQPNGSTGINASINGGTTAFSTASETANQTVTDVNEAPVITEGATAGVTMDEDGSPTAFALTLHATDGDGDTLTWSVQTAATHGAATASGTGTSKAIGYTPGADYNGGDSFVVLVSDGSGGEATITVNVTVNARNDAPVNTVPVGQTVNEETNLAFITGNGNAITVADADVAETVNGKLMITLVVSHGRLYLAQSTGLTFTVGDGSADPTMTFNGLPSSINAAMNGMVYQGDVDYSGSDLLSILTSDLGNTGSGGVMTDMDAVDITVTGANDAPVLNNLNYTLASVTEDQTDNAGTLVTALITSGGGDGITDSDPGAQEGIAIIARDNTHGVWEYSLDGVNWTDLGAVSSASARLLYADGNTWLRFNPALSYNNAQTPTLVFRAWDRTGGLTNGSTANVSVIGTGGATPFSTASDSAGIYVTAVNDAPVLDSSGSMSLTTIPEDVLDADNVGTLVQDIILSAGGNRITDVDTGMLEGIALVGADGANGTWQFSTNNGALWTACGSLSDLFATVLRSDAVTRIRFVPVANFSGSAYIVFRAWDQTSGQPNGSTGINASINGGTTAFSTASETANQTVTDVNEAPVITEGATAGVTMDEDGSPTAFALTLHATDGDGDTLTWSVQTAATHGAATASGTGTSKAIGYTPGADYNGGDSFVVLVSDGSGGEATITVNVTVNARNDAPVNTVPIGQTVNEETNLAFITGNGNALTVADADVAETGNGNLMITLAVSHGRLYLAQSTGLTFTVGDGSADPTMTFNGLPSSINAAMNGMVYQGDVDYSGSDLLSILTSDLGNTGSGGVQTDADSVGITINNVNDPPVITLSIGGVTYTENDAAVLIDGAAGVTDPDSSDFDGGWLTVTPISPPEIGDWLSVHHEGSGPGQIGLDSFRVTYGGTWFGTYWGGIAHTPLEIALNTNASVAAVDALIRNITFYNNWDDPSTATRTVQYVVTDGDGGTSNAATRTIDVIAVNDPPTILRNSPLSLDEGAPAAVTGAAHLAVNDPDNAASQIVYTVAAVPAHGTLRNVGADLGIGSTFTQDDLDTSKITYTHDGTETVSDGFSFTVADGAGGTIGLTVFSMAITAINDAPVITLSMGGVTYTENDAAVLIDGAAGVTDPDSSDFDGGWLTVTPISPPEIGDWLSVHHEGSGPGQIGLDSFRVTYGGTWFGTYWGGIAHTALEIALNTNASVAAVDALIRNITFYNNWDDPSTATRTVQYVVTDGDGGTSNAATRTIAVIAVNDPPVILRNNPLSVNEGATATVTGASHLACSDMDNTASQILYQLTSSTQRGALKLNGTPLLAGNSFTQADLDSSLITYENGGGEFLADSFSFTVTDGAGGDIGLTSFNITIVSVNDPPEMSGLAGANVVDADAGETAYEFTVTFWDDSAVDVSTLDNNDVYVTTPGAGTIAATFISVDDPGNGTPRTATYRIVPPGGSWDIADNGTYTIGINGNQVGDADATYVSANANIGTFSVTLETVAPTVTNVTSSTADGSYKSGDTISIQVVLSEAVNVTGAPLITLETGTADAIAAYAGGSGTTTLSFLFTVAASQETTDLDYVNTGALTLNGGTIMDAVGNSANLILPIPGTAGSLGANKAIVIDTTAPAAPTAPDLESASDTGSSSTDNVTDVTTPTFMITGVESSSTVRLISSVDAVIATATVGEGQSSCAITPATALTQGAHVITVTQTDAAGNVSAASAVMTPNLFIAVAPAVTTQAATDIASASATGNGTIIALGLPSPTAHGLVWNTTGSPTLADSSTNAGAASAAGPFTGALTGLSPNTLYYVRAYATNSLTTVYGDQVTLTSLQTYTLTVNATNGTVAKEPDQATYDHGTVVELTPTAAEGYYFVDWSGDATGSDIPLAVTMDAAKTISANFAINTYTISGTVTAGGTGLAGVTMTGLPGSPVTAVDGSYTATVESGFSGTVTPTHAYYAFSPANRDYANVTADEPGQNYTASLMTTPQRQALIALYNSTNGDNWTNNSGWKSAPTYPDSFAMPGTEGTWYGVTVDAGTQAVTQIVLTDNNLSGTVPIALANLTSLLHLRLDLNNLTGSIPVELYSLALLQTLSLTSNQLSGQLPVEIGNLASLQTLEWSNNQLNGSLPAELGNLHNLFSLRLDNNQLSGPIPAQLGGLANLWHIYLDRNQLSGPIPAQLGNASNLRALHLENNQLSGPIPPELGNLTHLIELRLNSNMLSGSIPGTIANLVNLTTSYQTDFGYNSLYTSDETLITFLNAKDPDWAATQTIAPTGVTATSLDNAVILVSWLPIAYAGDTGFYKVMISQTAGGPYTLAGQTENKTTSSLNVTGLTPSTRYYFVVQTHTDAHANNPGTVESENSAEATAVAWTQINITISGTVTLAGSPLAGVVMGGLTGSPVTTASGFYTGTEAAGSTFTITPTLDGYTFAPTSRTYTGVTTDQTSQDYVASAILPTLTVTSPNGGESWAAGSTHAVTWTETGMSGDVTIDLYKGGVYRKTLGTAGATAGTFTWTIALSETNGANYRVLVWQTGVSDESGADFLLRRVKVDFNRDGEEDLLWRYQEVGMYAGTNCIWLLNQTGGFPLLGAAQQGAVSADLMGAAAPGLSYGTPLAAGNAQMKGSSLSPLRNEDLPMLSRRSAKRDPLNSDRERVVHAKYGDLLGMPTLADTRRISAAGDGSVELASLMVAQYLYAPGLWDLGWEIAGAGDFNGDGLADIFWRNYGDGGYSGADCIWFMNGQAVIGYGYVHGVTDLDWRIEATGDFNGDGMADLLWRCYGTGQFNGFNCIWYMNGEEVIGYGYPIGVTDLDWKIVGTGDFNRDGNTDILWRNYGSGGQGGTNCIWYMNGEQVIGYEYPYTVLDLNWRIEGTGDFNKDGYADILWRYYGSGGIQGANCVWYMQGRLMIGVDYPPGVTDRNWRIGSR